MDTVPPPARHLHPVQPLANGLLLGLGLRVFNVKTAGPARAPAPFATEEPAPNVSEAEPASAPAPDAAASARARDDTFAACLRSSIEAR